MTAELFPGCHVVCLDARWPKIFCEPSPLEQGRVYVVTAIGWDIGFGPDETLTEGVVLLLDGVLVFQQQWPFFASRFRPLDEARLAWARDIATNPWVPVEVPA